MQMHVGAPRQDCLPALFHSQALVKIASRLFHKPTSACSVAREIKPSGVFGTSGQDSVNKIEPFFGF